MALPKIGDRLGRPQRGLCPQLNSGRQVVLTRPWVTMRVRMLEAFWQAGPHHRRAMTASLVKRPWQWLQNVFVRW